MLLDAAKQGVKTAALFFWENIKFVVPGLLLTLVLAVWLLAHMQGGPGSPAARAGGAGAILALLTNPPVLAFVIFVVAFPLAYFNFGRQRGFACAVQFLTAERKDAMAGFIVERFTGFIERKKPQLLGNAVQSQQDWLALFEQFIHDKQGLPKPLRKVIQHYARKLDIAQAIGLSASQTHGPITTQQLTDSVTSKLSGQIDAMGQLPSVRWYWCIVLVQIVYFGLVKSYL
jgi:hypothetical protein